MTYYIRYISTDEKPITFPEIEEAVQSFGDEYAYDGECLLYHDNVIGQLDITIPGDELFDSDMRLMQEFAEQKESKEAITADLLRAKCLLTIQVVLLLPRDEVFEAMDALLDWLFANRSGILMDEGGYFQNVTGDLD